MLGVLSVISNSPKAILDKIDTHSLEGFARYIKSYILQSYQEICTVVNCYMCGVPVQPQGEGILYSSYDNLAITNLPFI